LDRAPGRYGLASRLCGLFSVFVVRLGLADDHGQQGKVDLPAGVAGLVQDVVAVKLRVGAWWPWTLEVGVGNGTELALSGGC